MAVTTVACSAMKSMVTGMQSGLASVAIAATRSPHTQRTRCASCALSSRRRRASKGENVKTAPDEGCVLRVLSSTRRCGRRSAGSVNGLIESSHGSPTAGAHMGGESCAANCSSCGVFSAGRRSAVPPSCGGG